MTPEPSLARAADETAGRQPHEAGPPGEAASAPQEASAQAVSAMPGHKVRRQDLEESRRMTMIMLTHLSDGVNGTLNFALQYTVERLKDPFLTLNRMQRELRRIIAQEEHLDLEDAERVERRIAEGVDVALIDLALVEARRAARRRDLDISQTMTTAMIALLVKGLNGLLAGVAHDAVDRLADPFQAMNRMQRELRRIIALAERLEEDDFQRAARLAAAQAEALRDAEIRREADAESRAQQEKKDTIRNALRFLVEDAWPDEDPESAQGDEDSGDGDSGDGDSDDDLDGGGDRDRRENLLDDLFDDYDTQDRWDRDPVEIVARMCARLGLKPEPDPSVAANDGDKPVEKQARTLELARYYLREAGWPPTPAPATDGRGPPDG